LQDKTIIAGQNNIQRPGPKFQRLPFFQEDVGARIEEKIQFVGLGA